MAVARLGKVAAEGRQSAGTDGQQAATASVASDEQVRQNPPQSKVRPVDDKARTETAEIMTGLIRHIWNNGDAVYAIAMRRNGRWAVAMAISAC